MIELGQMLMRQLMDLDPNNVLLYMQRVSLTFETIPPSGNNWGIENPFTSEIRDHRGFIWLHRQSEFNAAFSYFEERMQKRELQGRVHAILQMRFLQIIASQCGDALLRSDHQPRKFTKAEKKHAVDTAKEIVEVIEQGICRSNLPMRRISVQSLNSLIDNLSKPAPREYSGPYALQRAHSIGLADRFRDLGLQKNEIVFLIDTVIPIFGFTPDHRSVQRYVRKAFSR